MTPGHIGLPRAPDNLQLRPKFAYDQLRHRRCPVLESFAVMHDNLATIKVNVFYPVRYRRKRPLM